MATGPLVESPWLTQCNGDGLEEPTLSQVTHVEDGEQDLESKVSGPTLLVSCVACQATSEYLSPTHRMRKPCNKVQNLLGTL